jgi:hypothetical protein
MNMSPTPQNPHGATRSALRIALFKLLMLSAGLSLLPAVQAVTLPFYDGFNYNDGLALGVVGSSSTNDWTVGNSPNASSPLVTSAAGLTYAGLPVATGLGVQLDYPGTSAKERGVDTLSYSMTGANETLYASFLLNVQSYPASNCPVAYYDENASASGSFQGVGMLPDGRLTLHRNAGITAPGGTNAAALSLNTTYLVVFRYKSIASTGNDQLALWINPTLGQPGETAPDLTMSVGGSDRTTLKGFFWKQDTTFSGMMFVDELRLGANWTDVTPGAATCDTASISSGPTNITVEAGNAAVFSVTSAGTSRTHQWQVSTDNGANWNDTSTGTGSTTASYNTGSTTSGENGYQYRCIVNVACDSSSATSGVATLTVTCNTAGISSQPSSIAVDAGQTANFSLTATGSSPTYQWEVSTDTGSSWSPVSSGTGGTTASHTTAATTTAESGYQYRCIVSVACDSSSVTSSVVTLTVSCSTADITAAPVSSAVPEGLSASFTVTATGSSPTYQWEVSADSGANWAPVSSGTGGTTASHTTAATTAGENGYQYRCLVSTACDSMSVTSAVATLTVVAPGGTSFRSAASGSWNAPSTWQLSGDNGANWFAAGVTPTTANSTNILIASGTTVMVTNSDVTLDDTTVAAGGNLTIGANRKITIADGADTDLIAYGTVENLSTSGSALTLAPNATMVVGSGGVLVEAGTSSGWVSPGAGSSITFASGGKFQLVKTGGRIPIATWNAGSTCEIAYTENGSRPDTAYLSQDFANFTVNCPLNTSGWDFAGTLTNVLGNFTATLGAEGGGIELKLFSGSTSSGGLNIGGNLTMNSGRLNVASSGGPWIITLTSNIFIGAGASMDVSGSSGQSYTLILNGSGTQTYTCDGVNIATKLNWTVNSGSTLNLNSDLPLTTGGRTLTVEGTIYLNGKTLLTDLLAGSGAVRNQGGGSGLLVVGAGNGINTLGAAPSLVNGTSGTLGLGKSGSGTLTITDPQTFGGGLVVSNGTVLVNNASGSGTGSGAVTVVDGTLGGTGIIAGSVSVQSAGNLAPGNSIEDLTINGTVTLGGTFTAEVNTGAAPNTDRILGTSAKNYGGTLEIVNQGSPLTAADTFQVFPAGIRAGGFGGIVPANPDNNIALAWDTSTLTTDGTLRISNVGSGPSTTPTNIVSTVSGGNLTLTWPDTHIGWTLQAQTNSRSVGLSSNWSAFDGGYTTTNEAVIPIDKTTPTVFFRLFYQTP